MPPLSKSPVRFGSEARGIRRRDQKFKRARLSEADKLETTLPSVRVLIRREIRICPTSGTLILTELLRAAGSTERDFGRMSSGIMVISGPRGGPATIRN